MRTACPRSENLGRPEGRTWCVQRARACLLPKGQVDLAQLLIEALQFILALPSRHPTHNRTNLQGAGKRGCLGSCGPCAERLML